MFSISALTLLPLLPALLPALVSAHGYMGSVGIAGKTFPGNIANASPSPSIIREINDVNPVKGASNPNLSCGQNAKIASLVAQAMPGDEVSFTWKNGENGNWVHNVGPMMTYMASCGSSPCSQFDASSASWFKINQVGRVSPGGAWAQSLMNDGSPAKINLPSNIAPGNYLIRHELIALQIAQTVGGAEFYPACMQVQVGGNGTGVPAENETVKMPGAYNDNDKGLVVDVYSNPNAEYEFPGPKVAAFVNGSADATSSTSASDSIASSTPAAAAATSASSVTSSSGACRKRSNQVIETVARPRTFSRVMRSLVNDSGVIH